MITCLTDCKGQRQTRVLVAGPNWYKGSVLGPLLFNSYLNDLFYLAQSAEVCHFSDDSTFFDCDKDLKTLISRSEHDNRLAIEWFENKYMKLIQDKCHL